MSQNWNTPKEYVQLMHRALRGRPHLDPFSNAHSLTGAMEHWYGPDADEHAVCGFDSSWAAMGDEDGCRVVFNPPWRRAGEAVRKAVAEWEQEGPDVSIVGLIPSSINSRHWPLIERAPARCYPHKRLHFTLNGEARASAKNDVALFYLGPDPYVFADTFCTVGRIHFGVIG